MRERELWIEIYCAAVTGMVREYSPPDLIDSRESTDAAAVIARDSAILADAGLREYLVRFPDEDID